MAEVGLPVGAKAIMPRRSMLALIDVLAVRGYQVLGPTLRDGAIVHDEVAPRVRAILDARLRHCRCGVPCPHPGPVAAQALRLRHSVSIEQQSIERDYLSIERKKALRLRSG